MRKSIFVFCQGNRKKRPGKGGGLQSENEDILLKFYCEKEMLDLLEKDYFKDAKTIIAIQRYFLNKELYK